jgi:alpha-1,3-mannosyltransferase
MKVVHIVRQFSPSIGGFEDVVLNLCRELRSTHGFDASVVTLDRLFSDRRTRLAPREVIEGIPVTRIPFFGSNRYPIAPGLFGQIGGADLLHVHAIDYFFDALALTRWLHGKPMVASTHGGFFHTGFAAGFKKVYFNTVTRMSCRAYDRVCASSESDRAIFTRVTKQNLTLVENGVDILKWRDAGSAAIHPTLIFIGRFATNKRVAHLFPILHELRKFNPSWRLIVAGREYDQRIPELEEISAVAGVRDAVKFVNAPTDAECRALIGAASYFISGSAHEGFGLSAVEALSAGLIPVLSDIPPFRQLIDRSGVGRLIDVLAPAEAARSVQQLHESYQANAVGWRAQAIQAANRYTWPAIAAQFVDIYASALGGTGRSLDAAPSLGNAAE